MRTMILNRPQALNALTLDMVKSIAKLAHVCWLVSRVTAQPAADSHPLLFSSFLPPPFSHRNGTPITM